MTKVQDLRVVAEFVCVLILSVLGAAASVAALAGHEGAGPGVFAAALALSALFAAAAVVSALGLAADRLPGGPQRVRARVMRALALRLAYLSLRDPDGPGQTRPRAPGGAVLTAA